MKNYEAPVSRAQSIALSLFSWVSTVVLTMVLPFLSFIFIFPFYFLWEKLFQKKGRRTLFHRVAVLWGTLLIRIFPLAKLKISGVENADPNQHYVIVANHQSILDILVALASIPCHFKFVAKKELFSIPFIGWHMRWSGYMPLLRGDHESGKQVLNAATQWIRSGVGVLFFPEGTRSLDGQIKAFKAGAFLIAQQEKVPILPMVFDGTGDALPKHSWRIQKRTSFKVSIGKPRIIRPSESVDQAVAEVRRDMIERLAALRSSPGSC